MKSVSKTDDASDRMSLCTRKITSSHERSMTSAVGLLNGEAACFVTDMAPCKSPRTMSRPSEIPDHICSYLFFVAPCHLVLGLVKSQLQVVLLFAVFTYNIASCGAMTRGLGAFRKLPVTAPQGDSLLLFQNPHAIANSDPTPTTLPLYCI